MILPFFAWGNPFSPYIIPKNQTSSLFHYQKRTFDYPFQQSFEVPNGVWDVERWIDEKKENGLNEVEKTYKDIQFDRSTAVYAYPFLTHPEWEILPYPYVSNIQDTLPTQWVKEFKTKTSVNEGVRSFEFHQSLDGLTDSKSYTNNKLKLFKTPQTMEEIYLRISESEKHIFISSFMFQCDQGMEKFLGHLEERIHNGVEVYLIYDQKFSLTNPNCKKRLKEMGVNVALHGAKSPLNVFHEKMMVFDGKVAMVLGQNMIASQVLSSGVNNLFNDMAIRSEGPMVEVIASRFLEHWSRILKREMNPDIIKFYSDLKTQNEKYSTAEAIKMALQDGRGLCRLVTKNPGKKNKSISSLYSETVKETKNYLFFNMIDVAFRNPDGSKTNEKFLREVIEKANQLPSLRVDMLTNNWKLPTDVETRDGSGISQNIFSKISVAFGRIVTKRPHKEIPKTQDSIREVLKSQNFHWWSYSQYQHAKTLMSDNIWSLVGSYNINPTSEAQSYEQVMACLDSELAEEFQRSIVTDALNSIPVPLDTTSR